MRENPPHSERGKAYAKANTQKKKAELRLEWAQEKLENAGIKSFLHQKDEEEHVDESIGEYLPFAVIWTKEGKDAAGYKAEEQQIR